MTYTASAPNAHEADGGFAVTVATPAEVTALVERLADPATGTAHIEGGYGQFVVLAHIEGGYGYLFHADDSDDGEAVYSLGDPASPAIDAEESFPAGSGITTIALTAALTELLTSGRQPTSIRWRVLEPAGGQPAAS